MFQLVLQFAPWSDRDFDALVRLEDELESVVGLDEVDGHDLGADEANMFIITEKPESAFQAALPVITAAGLLDHLSAGCCSLDEDVYARIWPVNDASSFVVKQSVATDAGTLRDCRSRWLTVAAADGFSYGRFDPIGTWHASFYALADSVAPRKPFTTVSPPRLDFMWYRPMVPGVPQSNFRIAATAEVKLGAGRYVLRTISDDAIRVWVNDELVIDNWKPHESEVNLAAFAPGTHKLRVEYYQRDGWTELRVEVVLG